MTNKTIDCLPAMQQKRSTQVPHLAIWLWFSTFSRTLSEPPATYVNWWILSRSPLKMATSGKSATLVEDSISLPYTFGSISIPGNPTTAVLRCLRLRLRGPKNQISPMGKLRIIDSKSTFKRLIDIHSCCAFGEKRCLYIFFYFFLFVYLLQYGARRIEQADIPYPNSSRYHNQ